MVVCWMCYQYIVAREVSKHVRSSMAGEGYVIEYLHHHADSSDRLTIE